MPTGFLYVEQDESHRPFRVMLHRLGTDAGRGRGNLRRAGSRLVHRRLGLAHRPDGDDRRARPRRLGDAVIDLEAPTAQPLLVAPRRPGHFYDVLDHGDRVFIRTNAGARDFKIVEAPRAAPAEANWREVVAASRRLLFRRCRGSRGLARSAGARGEPPAPDRPRPRDWRAPRRRLRRGDLRARFRGSTSSTPTLPLRLFRRWRGPRKSTTTTAPRASGRWSSGRSSRRASIRQPMSSRLLFAPAADGETRAGVAPDAARREARRLGAAASLWLRRLWLCDRGELFHQSALARRSRLRLRDRPCARRDRQGLALVRGRQAREEAEHLLRLHRRRAASDRRGLYGAKAASSRRAAARAAC